MQDKSLVTVWKTRLTYAVIIGLLLYQAWQNQYDKAAYMVDWCDFTARVEWRSLQCCNRPGQLPSGPDRDIAPQSRKGP
jgi:hypothetical protein